MPVTAEFARWLAAVPEEERRGFVIDLVCTRKEKRLSAQWVGRIVSRIGGRAGVVVNAEEEKMGSAHDFRRSYATGLVALGVKPLDLQRLMRHADIKTTMKHYARQDADELAERLWEAEKLNDLRERQKS